MAETMQGIATGTSGTAGVTSVPTVADAYAGIDHSHQAWRRGERTPVVARRYLAGLWHLGMQAAALRTARQLMLDFPDWQAVWADVVDREIVGTGGRVAWSSRRRRYEANLQVLARRYPEASYWDALWRVQSERYELHQSVDGEIHIWDGAEANPLSGWRRGIRAHSQDGKQINLNLSGPTLINPIVIDGPGYGFILQQLLEQTRRSYLNYSCAVHIIEPDSSALMMLMHLHDLRKWLDDSRLRLWIGADACARFTARMRDDVEESIPGTMVEEKLTSRPAVGIKDVLESVSKTRAEQAAKFQERIAALYAGKDTAYWAKRFAEASQGGRPLRVMGITSRFTTVLQYSMAELGEAIKACGHEFRLSIERDDNSLESAPLKTILEYEPELLILISRMRYEHPTLPRNVPFLCWDQDNLSCMRTAEAKASLDDTTFVAGVGAIEGFIKHGWPRRNCIFVQPAGSGHRYSDVPADAELLKKHACDFSYLSNASERPEKLLADFAAKVQEPGLKAFLEHVGKELLRQAGEGRAWDRARIEDFFRASANEKGLHFAPAAFAEIIDQLRRITDRAFRHVALKWAVDFCRRTGRTMRLYGMGWDRHPDFAPYAAGFLEPGEAQRAVYQASKINLQIIETGFIHSRSLDGLAAGGFFLTRYAPEMRDIVGTGRKRYEMAKRALETGCVTYRQLDESQDEVIKEGWTYCRPFMAQEKKASDEVCMYLEHWMINANEEILFPGLDEITFSDKASFESLAEKYLTDGIAREKLQKRMRGLVMERFVYDARWKEFLAGITNGLKCAAHMGASGA